MVALGRPGAGEELLARWGFDDVRRLEVPFAWEFADPESYARALASTGPAYEAIQAVGEEAFKAYAVDLARERVRDGLPLRAEIKVVGYVARKPVLDGTVTGPSFLAEVDSTPEVEALFAEDREDLGYVMNGSRLWAQHPAAVDHLFGLLDMVTELGALTFRQRAALVLGTASTLGDAYCSLAWGGKLATKVGPEVAAAVIRGDDSALDPAEQALASWGRKVAADPNGTTPADVQALRDAGLDDRQVFAATVYAAGRIAFSTVNDALGALPDAALANGLPAAVRAAVTYGRPVARVRE
jgi:alkylhydroperoxidase family enzyme